MRSRTLQHSPSIRGKLFCSVGCQAVYELRARRFDPNLYAFLRGSHWQWTANQIRNRDNYTCQVCGRRKSRKTRLTVDHMVPLRLSMDDDWTNLITVCKACHRYKTGYLERMLILGDIPTFLEKLRSKGWPMRRINAALKRYGLPIRPFKWHSSRPHIGT
ncbi:MAG: HNH endonuclease [Candidatus Acidiferrales bacterium]